MMSELKKCPWCGGKAEVHPFIFKIAELPEPIKLFGRWSLIKMKYKEIPVKYNVECAAWCDGFAEFGDVYIESTKEAAINEWNKKAGTEGVESE